MSELADPVINSDCFGIYTIKCLTESVSGLIEISIVSVNFLPNSLIFLSLSFIHLTFKLITSLDLLLKVDRPQVTILVILVQHSILFSLLDCFVERLEVTFADDFPMDVVHTTLWLWDLDIWLLVSLSDLDRLGDWTLYMPSADSDAD